MCFEFFLCVMCIEAWRDLFFNKLCCLACCSERDNLLWSWERRFCSSIGVTQGYGLTTLVTNPPALDSIHM